MLTKLGKRLRSETLTHFFRFFAVFTAIFLVMTVIILQIMRYGLYSSVDSSLSTAVANASDYVTRTMERSTDLHNSTENTTDNADKSSTTINIHNGDSGLSNVNVLLYDASGTILNPFDSVLLFSEETLDSDELDLGTISTETVTTIFGTREKYHVITIEVSSDDYPEVSYARFMVSVHQLDEATERYTTITITIMVIFWLISTVASVYLAKWTRKPILESYEKQKAFVENASHELRTPLAVLQNRLENLFRKPTSTILDNSENIASSLDEVRNMRLLTTNLLNLARRDDGLKPEIAEIKATSFDEIFDNYQLIAEENEKVFISHNAVNRTVWTDKTLLKQLMTILFDNAVKYTDDDGVITFSIKTTDKQLILTVADNGSGIDDEDKKKIFDRFYRVDKARTRQKGGFGLGLSLAQQIVVSLHGSITVADNQPKGTVFEVKLPK